LVCSSRIGWANSVNRSVPSASATRPFRVAGLPPRLFGVDQQVVAVRLALGAEPHQAAPHPGAQPGVRQHERLRAQGLDEQVGLAAGHHPGGAGQQDGDLVRAGPAQQVVGTGEAFEHAGGPLQQIGVPVGADPLGPVRLDPDDQHRPAAAALRPVHLVGETGAGQQAGGRVLLDDRRLHGLAAAAQPGHFTAGAFAGGDVTQGPVDADHGVVRADDRFEPAVHVEPATVVAHQPYRRADRLARRPGAGDRAEGLGMVVDVHVPGEDLLGQLVAAGRPAEQAGERVGPDDLLAGGQVGEPGLVVGGRAGLGQRQLVALVGGEPGAAGEAVAQRAGTRKAFFGCRHAPSLPPSQVNRCP
jgi:hypothetical protein